MMHSLAFKHILQLIMTGKNSILAGVILLATLPLWLRFAVPWLERIPSSFEYHADITSYDNVFDEQKGNYLGETRSITRFTYSVLGEEQGVLNIRNEIDVQAVTGEKIFSTERLYGVNTFTRKHVSGFGDRDREGYLFAPRHLKEGEPFTYWHINYDGPAHMTFAGKENLFGLPVYRYETRYKDIRIDQTKNLEHLPDVGVTRGIELEPYLQLWIEPTTGHLVKYADDAIAYFYDLNTGARLHPWNHFRNTFTTKSVSHQVEIAQRERIQAVVLEWMIPVLVGSISLLFILVSFRKKRGATIALVVIITMTVLAEGFLWRSTELTSEKNTSGPIETMRIGAERGLLAASVWIADHNGYFTEEGLDVQIETFSSGRAAFASMLQGNPLDIVTVAQTPVTLFSFERNDFSIIAGMVTSPNDVKILARKDRGIATPEDLRGKKIGLTRNTTGHYFLALYLAQYGMEESDVIVEEMDTAMLTSALQQGNVDAISTWEPHIYETKQAMGENALNLESRDTFREDFYFVAFKDTLDNYPDRIKKFLRAIGSAVAFMETHPKETQNIMALELQLDPSYISSVWNDFSYGLFLDQAIILSLEQQARWMTANGITKKDEAPNYLEFLNFEILESVKPDAVSIIH